MALADYFSIAPENKSISPQSLEQRRRLAQALQKQGMDYSPIRSPWQGAARVAQALSGAWDERSADKIEGQKQQEYSDKLKAALAGGDTKSMVGMIADPWAPSGAAQAIGMINSNQNQAAQLAQSAQFHKDQMAQSAAQLQLQRELSDKGQFTQIGLDAYGQPQYGVFQPKSGAVTPYGGANGAAGGQGGGSPVPGGPPAPGSAPAPGGPVVGGMPVHPGEDIKTVREMTTKHNVQQALDAPQQMQGVVNMIGMLDSSLNDPGLDAATGWGNKFPTFPGSQAANFETKHQQLMGKSLEQGIAFLQGKGAMSDAEGKAAREGFSRLSLNLSPADYRKALGEVRGLMNQSLENLKAKSRGAPVPSPAVNAGGGNSPMFATNAQTKQRIMSTDGGKTWQIAQ